MNLYLRTTDKDGKAHGGFQWPMEVGAIVTAPDWKPTAECGNGLHGLLDGLFDASHLNFDADAVWWIVEAADAIDLSGKHKFQSCKVVAFGPRHEVTAKLHALRPGPIHGLCLAAGDNGQAAAGRCGHATAGDNGQATAGDYGHATAGDNGHATAGNSGQATAGDYGQATAGYNGQATAGYRGQATAGNNGQATAGYNGQATAGYNGVLIFLRWIGGRRRVLTAYVGEDGILPNVAYRASDGFKTVVAA